MHELGIQLGFLGWSRSRVRVPSSRGLVDGSSRDKQGSMYSSVVHAGIFNVLVLIPTYHESCERADYRVTIRVITVDWRSRDISN